MAKQSFTTGSVLTAAQMNSLQANDYNWTVSQKTTSYVLTAADAGTRIEMNSASPTTVTVNTGLFSAGDTLFIQNIGAGVCTVTAGTATVQKSSNASLALAQYQGGYLYFISASNAVFFADAGFTSPLTTKGDLFTWDTGNQRLAVGTNGQYLSADSTAGTGLKWVTPSGGMTLLSTTTLSGSSTNISVTSTGYNMLQLQITGVTASADTYLTYTLNADTTANYNMAYVGRDGAGSFSGNPSGGSSYFFVNGNTTMLGSNSANATTIFIYDPNNGSSQPKNTVSVFSGVNSSSQRFNFQTIGSKISVGAITSIEIKTTAGTWSGGTALVYGVK